MEENLPPGFRFHPTAEELISYYLTRKVSDFGFVATAIADVDLNKCEPWDLPGKASMGKKEWYFFSMRDLKYPTGLRTNRATDAGYWKTTGKDKEIFQHGMLVGMKKTLVFYKGRAPKGEKTNWVMHEYKRQTKFPYTPSKEEWVVCRVFRKSSSGKKPHPNANSLLESPCNTTSLQTELGEMDVSGLSNLVNHLGCSYAMQTNDSSSTNSSSSNKVDMDLYMSWVLAREASNQLFVSWPSSLVSSASPSAQPMVLPFAGYQPIKGSGKTMSSIDEHGDPSSLVAESKVTFPASRAKGVVQAAQQPPFDQELFWRGY